MILRGAGALTNSELLAVLIGSGTGEKNAVDIAREVLSGTDGSLVILSAMPIDRLVREKGIGKAKAVAISAALELGRRCFHEASAADKHALTSPSLVYNLMLPTMLSLDHEESWVLYLNRKSRLIGKELSGSGSMEKTVIDTQKILRHAIEKQARHVIMVHNHPGGSPEPSEADIRQTEILRKALSAVDITLLDHVIVAGDKYFSFMEDRVGP